MKTQWKWIAAALCASAIAHAQQPVKPENQVKFRKSAYQVMNYSLDTLEAMGQGKQPYAKDEAAKLADILLQVSILPQRFFGEGTGGGETRAKPEIWTHRADFDKKMDAMIREAQKLPAAARSGDIAALKKAVGDVDEACKSCHDEYRVKRK